MRQRRKRGLFASLIMVLLLAVILTYNPVSVRIMTVAVAVRYDIDPALFYRLIRTESNFRSFAISPKSAIGLGQMQDNTAYYIHSAHKRGLLFLPPYNLSLSAKYLRYLQDKYQGNTSLVLAAYNWGETNVSHRLKGKRIDPTLDYRESFHDIPETYNYIGRILPERKKS